MTYCCRICTKKFTCENYGKIEDCKECVSYVLQAMREIDKKIQNN